MGNLQKIPRSSVTAILGEIERTDDSVHYDPETHNIDYDRTSMNYSVLPMLYYDEKEQTALENFNDRLSELKVQNRDDVKVLGQWVWTAPKDLDEEYYPELFQYITEYMIQKHGVENVIYAQVHMDETQPHLHIGIIPAVDLPPEKIKEGGPTQKVCAKEVFTKAYLQSIHAEVEQYVGQQMGIDVNLINGESLGVKGIKNYKKAKELAKKVATLETEITEKTEVLTELETNIVSAQDELSHLRSEIYEARTELSGIRKLISKAQETLKSMKETIKSLTEQLKCAPNLFQNICYYLSGGRISEEEAEETEKRYNQHLEDMERSAHSYDDGLSL